MSKIGIISSGVENLVLLKLLNNSKYCGYERHIFIDSKNRPYSDKDFDLVLVFVTQAIEFLVSKGVEKVIVPPIFELYFREKNMFEDVILPLFSEYLNYCLNHSLVGKIGFLTDYVSNGQLDFLFKSFSKNFSINSNQKNIAKHPRGNGIKKFCFPFAIWKKYVPMRDYVLRGISSRGTITNQMIKFDVKYFKDANVDTVIPLNYGFRGFQSVISRFFNHNKQRFYKLDVLLDILDGILPEKSGERSSYVYCSGDYHILKENKRFLFEIGENVVFS